ncbi:MAG: sulfatase [Sedimentisphaerales bacterium]|nr:sulfatase [Sedimentisphaerales bacterium]
MDTKQKKLKNINAEAKFGLFDMLCFVIWFGLLSGLAEIAFLKMKWLVGGETVFLRSHQLWMIPAVNVVILCFLGLIALPVIMRLSRPKVICVACVILGSISFLSFLCLESGRFARIHFIAKVLLAIGLAMFLKFLISCWPLKFERFVRRTIICPVLIVVVLSVAVSGWRFLQERRIIASLSDSPPSAPNVLLIVLDTVRAESMSLYGYERSTTPYLMDLAGEGVVFQNAIATSSWTLPSHASLFTGRFPYEHLAVKYKPLDSTYPTLAEILNKTGYVTGGFTANREYTSIEHGIARGFVHYEDYVASVGEFARNSALIRQIIGIHAGQTRLRRFLGFHERLGRKPAPRITRDFLRWIDRVPSDCPFFAFLNYFDAHQPYLPPFEFLQRFGPTNKLNKYLDRLDHEPCLPSNTTDEEIESICNAYDAAIAYLDHDLKRLFTELRQRNLFDRTLVIITSDHGEEFAEHGTIGHAKDLQVQSIRVPLMLRLPGIVPAEVTVQEPSTLRDIPATVIELLGISDDGVFPGRSLSKYWTDSTREKSEKNELILSELSHASWAVGAPSEKGDMKSLNIGDMHYIRNGDSSEEVYDFGNDPSEQKDLIKTTCGAKTAAQARDILKLMIP